MSLFEKTVDQPTPRAYSIFHIVLAAFFSGPIGGGWMTWHNYKLLNRADKAKRTALISALVIPVMLTGLFLFFDIKQIGDKALTLMFVSFAPLYYKGLHYKDLSKNHPILIVIALVISILALGYNPAFAFNFMFASIYYFIGKFDQSEVACQNDTGTRQFVSFWKVCVIIPTCAALAFVELVITIAMIVELGLITLPIAH